MTAWSRLSAMNALLNARTYTIRSIGTKRTGRQISVTDDVKETIDILGRGNDVEIKHRLHWFMTFHPDIWEDVTAKARSQRSG